MRGFRYLFPRLLRHPWLFAGGLFFAMISAGGLGAGLLSLGPVFKIILDGKGDDSVSDLILQFNDSNALFRVPEALVTLLPNDPFNAIVTILAGLAILTVIGAIANFLHQFLALEISSRSVAGIRREVFAHVMNLPMIEVQSRGAAELVSRINKDSMALQGGIFALTGKLIANLTKGLAAFVAAVIFDWRLTIIALVVTPALAAILRWIGRRIRRATRAALEAQEDLLRVSSESIQGIRSVKTATAEPAANHRFDIANDEVLREELRVRTARALASPLVELLAVLVMIGLVLLAIREILEARQFVDAAIGMTDGLTTEGFLLTLGSLGVAGGSLRPLAGLITEIQAASAPAERLEELTELPDEYALASSSPTLALHERSIRFRNVSYRYPKGERDVLDGIDLEIEHGAQVAIVGPNGCGKTTMLSLLPRLFDPSQGVVEIDGTDIRSVELGSLRSQIGVVTQETVLFRGSIRENILFGREATDEQVLDAANLARATEFIEDKPEGFDTEVAELGASLSGGQRQRIVIARALLREPSILILDEATSQIDADSEKLINDAVSEFSRGRTVLVIAHRLSTVLAADRIVVMDEGRVIDQGVHDELMARCESYRRLAQTQLGQA